MIQLRLNKERKIILVIGGILLAWGVLYRLVPVYQELIPQHNEIELKKEQIIKFQKRIQTKEGLEKKQLALTKKLEQLKQGLLRGQTPALSAVSMQNRLNEIADSIALEVQAVRVLKSKPIENTEFISVPVQFSTRLTIRQLKRLLYKIETAESFLQVANLVLKKSGEGMPVQLQVTMTVTGLMQKSGGV